MENEEIEDLIYLIKQGNQEALNTLISFLDKYLNNILNKQLKFFLKYVDARELIQEGLISIEEVIRRYNYASCNIFITYYVVCVKNRWCTLASKYNPKFRKSKYIEVSLDQYLYSNDASENEITVLDTICDEYPMNHPKKSYYINEAIDNAYQFIINTKNEKNIKLFQLKVLGYSDEEIALMLNESKRWVTNSLYRIRKKLDLMKE